MWSCRDFQWPWKALFWQRGRDKSFVEWTQGRRKEKNWRQSLDNIVKEFCCQIKDRSMGTDGEMGEPGEGNQKLFCFYKNGRYWGMCEGQLEWSSKGKKKRRILKKQETIARGMSLRGRQKMGSRREEGWASDGNVDCTSSEGGKANYKVGRWRGVVMEVREIWLILLLFSPWNKRKGHQMRVWSREGARDWRQRSHLRHGLNDWAGGRKGYWSALTVFLEWDVHHLYGGKILTSDVQTFCH